MKLIKRKFETRTALFETGEKCRRWCGFFLCILGLTLPNLLSAEDADRFRPYLRFHSGDADPKWGVDDLWSFGLGANFNQITGGELALDSFGRVYTDKWGREIGEVSALSLTPELRLRKPLFNQRLVPYIVGGVGASFLQFNDRKKEGIGHSIDIEGYSLSVAAGGGLEYFIDDNIAFGIEGKYLWIDPIHGTVDGQSTPVDLSSPFLTFGLRIFFDENNPRSLITLNTSPSWRAFFGLRLGGGLPIDDDLIPGVTLTPQSGSLGKINRGGQLALGVDFRDEWGIELATDYVEPDLHVQGIGTVGEYSLYTSIPYLRLRHSLGQGRWQPYLVAGMGVGYTEFNDAKPSGNGLSVEANGIEPALGVGGGLEYFITRNFSWNLDVRWLYTWNHEIKIGNTMQGTADISALLFGVGFRVYLFEGKKR